jgi:NADPH-dependent 2,4-dienoyl-CoA reductase/sulfur reductase-like enzyme/CRP-like cAMP-binding protein/Fe-S-cluster-containing hydrogenase component 2
MGRQLSYVIIGNGIAGVTAAEILRAQDATASITIIADDPFPVYYRPALKDYLAGRVGEEKLWARPGTFYREQQIRFVPGRVVGINTHQHFVQMQNGRQIGYDKLLLANGARPRRLTCHGLNLAGVSTLRTVADYREILYRLANANRIVICGSGTLALESAEILQQYGYEVTHLLRYHTLWSEVLDATASDLVLQEERRAGVDVRTGEEIVEVVGQMGRVSEVITSGGAHILCDQVLIAIGIEPIISFIESSGIACGRGVKVDAAMRTNAVDVYAAGDVIETTDSLTGQIRVLGQWYPAIQQAQIAAYSMLDMFDSEHAGSEYKHYYNATLLYGLDFVSVGLTTLSRNAQIAQHLRTIVAPPGPQSYRKVMFHSTGVPLGILFLGNRENALAFKRAIEHRVNLASVANYLFANDFNLDQWLDKQQVPPAILNVQQRERAGAYHSINSEHSSRDSNALHGIPSKRSAGLLNSQRTLHKSELTAGAEDTAFLHIGGSALDGNTSRVVPDVVLARLKDAPTLVLMSQDAEPQLVPIVFGSSKRYSLGRDKENDICLDDKAASRRHAELFTATGGFYISDMGSSNGVFVNKVKINNPHHLSHGDRVVLGNTLIYCWFPQATTSTWHTCPPDRVPQGPSQPRITSLATTFQEDPALTESSPARMQVAKELGPAHRSDVEELSEERIHFEIDMCIGCDRCMYACPIPMSSQVSIADLNHATISADVARHIARFTHECIMCGSCVPVCPVDNHRDLLMLSLKQRLGVSWDAEVDMKRVAEALPAGWTIPLLISRLRQHPLLNNAQMVPDLYLLHLFVASQLLSLAPGATVIREGEYGRDLYLILTGHVSVLATEADGKELPMAILGQGEYIGEYGMLTGQPYTTTARAQTPCVLLQVPEQVMQRLMELLPNVRQFFDQLNTTRSLTSILKRMALFQGIADADIDTLVRQTQVRQYERNERLFTEGDMGGRPFLHILLEGFVKVARRTTAGTGHHKSDERIIAYRQAGDYFVGGLDMLGDGQAVTVTTINRTRVAEVPRQFLQALLQRYPEVNQRFQVRLREYYESTAVAQANGQYTNASPNVVATEELHALVSDGVIEGTEVLVIDLDTCIHCNECEEACTRRHGHSRMNRKGMVVGNISIATACRQCQNPVCMLCSRAGIARLPNGEVYITESCIGCGICAERCPYGAISIVDAGSHEDEAVARTSWQRFSSFFTNGSSKERKTWYPQGVTCPPGRVPLHSETNYVAPGPLDTFRPRSGYAEMRKKVAIKCDLCAGYKDQACVEACPTGAAIRIQPTTFFGSTEEILRQRRS